MTKKELRDFLIKQMSPYARQGYHYEAHVYTDKKHWERDAGQHKSLFGEFLTWADAKKEVAPGRVFDVFIYRSTGPVGFDRDRELISNEVIQLPGGE